MSDIDEIPVTEAGMKASWRERGACVRVFNVDMTFALAWLVRDSPGSRDARKVCQRQCPVRETCLRDALTDANAIGLRGGFFFENGVVRRPDARRIAEEFGLEARTAQRQKMSA